MGKSFDFSDWDEVGGFIDAALATPGWHSVCIQAGSEGLVRRIHIDGGAS